MSEFNFEEQNGHGEQGEPGQGLDYESPDEPARVWDVGTAQQPERQTPLTGDQARKDLIESEPPERKSAEAVFPESAEEIGYGNGLIESGTPKGSARRKA
ncbi:hypothetical protein GT204_15735 [Streptomyces sp. SID4919]|uniref:hypothetical protein n=1 Tax=unclassified Streptomyces TaxID=2593676 RepID=UPI000823B8E2|nr:MULTISPECIES: hypothetical protein [unclassified Streptomyces]MYY10314.1 hypothetical protein [Streptomyces sp. SID4919]SCK63242.1 hypothetical protein YW7DRAFT_07056 [Streptomyces sp. AmelKG-E11A]